MKLFFNILIMVVCTAVAGTFLYLASGMLVFKQSGPDPTASNASGNHPIAVSVCTVAEMSVREWDDFSGRVQAVDRVEIRPQVSGVIQEVHFQDGQLVKKGDLLFLIDPRPFQAEVERTKAVVDASDARLTLSKANSDRDEVLIQNHAIAQSEYDLTKDACDEARANLSAAKAAARTAELNLEYTSVVSPIDGRVSRPEITEGNWVFSGSSSPVMTRVVSVSPVYVEFEMDEQTFLKYSAEGLHGDTGLTQVIVKVGLANEADYPHEGRVYSIDNEMDVSSGTIRVRGILQDGEAFTPGQYARVRTGPAEARPTVVIDDRAVGSDQDKKYVMVVSADNKVSYRPVVLGPIVDGLRVVRSGLKKDERIVVNGLQLVRPDSVVQPTEVAAPTPTPDSLAAK